MIQSSESIELDDDDDDKEEDVHETIIGRPLHGTSNNTRGSVGCGRKNRGTAPYGV